MQDLCAGNAMPPMLEFMQSAIEWQVLRRPDPLIHATRKSRPLRSTDACGRWRAASAEHAAPVCVSAASPRATSALHIVGSSPPMALKACSVIGAPWPLTVGWSTATRPYGGFRSAPVGGAATGHAYRR